MKKNILITIIVGIILCVCACGNSNEETNKNVDVSHVEYESSNYVENDVPEVVTEVVELTIDNWQDYYEFKVSVREERNEFDDIETLWMLKTSMSERLLMQKMWLLK